MESDMGASGGASVEGRTVANRFGFWIAIATAALTVVTFALALTALPNAVPYPFTSDVIAEQWPLDYVWMFPAMILMVMFVALVAAVHEQAPAAGKLFSRIGFGIALIAAAVLLIDYFVQVTVMQISLEKGQLDGWALLTQYNPNGVFVALEELGYLLMSLALFCLIPAFAPATRLHRALRWLFGASFAAVIVALVVVSALRGMDRGDDFEIIAISLVWLTLIAGGVLMALVFRRDLGDLGSEMRQAKTI